jgi:hypothetical protein
MAGKGWKKEEEKNNCRKSQQLVKRIPAKCGRFGIVTIYYSAASSEYLFALS